MLVTCGAGMLICGIAILQLNKNLTTFPSPVQGGRLITTGMFKYVRHPIYSGLIVSFSAFAGYNGSLGKLLVTLLIVILLYFKSRYEENRLENAYPDYPVYRQHTGRFFPRIRKLINY